MFSSEGDDVLSRSRRLIRAGTTLINEDDAEEDGPEEDQPGIR